MCGLFGVLAAPGQQLREQQILTFTHLGRQARRRGSDASGIVRVDAGGAITVVKSDLDFGALAKSPAARNLTDLARRGSARALFGHSRLETHGFSAAVENNQPVIVGDWVVLHNGIITNHEQIRADHPSVDVNGIDSDTASIGVLLTDWHRRGRQDAIDEVFAHLEGEYSIIAVSTFGDVLLHTNVGNLYTVTTADGEVLVASEPRQYADDVRDRATRLPLDQTMWLAQPGDEHGVVSVSEAGVSKARSFGGAQGLHLRHDGVDGRFVTALAAVAETAHVRAAGLRRCTQCVLPESFPGIEFDADGCCSVCAQFVQPRYDGVEALVRDLTAASPDGRSVLVCLSGGRDSCYVLHLVKELGFDPIAYTYDWGMVTTAARENMAKLCGALGTEHILVSPNIRKNRLRIQRALTAWLRHPRVGTLPILMAGDKPYFRYARIVAAERGGLPAVMADHPLETTGFKSMLAGAKPGPSDEGGVAYRLDKRSLGRMIGSYGAHAMRAPGLFPSLVAEGAVGFFDYYMRSHDFVRPFSYIPWDEAVLESTLRQHYGWSAGEDRSSSSWRMGDGTAPFYNLMYLIALGMTEHDALRANQVRFGLSTREVALAKLTADNQVNPLGVASYFATVDLDPDWAIRRIEAFSAANDGPLGTPLSLGRS
ncbi:MAG: hypothetical protein AB7Q42_01045 [Acidimicrobiia bacterium]